MFSLSWAVIKTGKFSSFMEVLLCQFQPLATSRPTYLPRLVPLFFKHWGSHYSFISTLDRFHESPISETKKFHP
ncbi:Uncharacterized protein TCM_010660 [Theobroma cacao]|uniref:Uncharacterized protein n=1 Tax=Theobroma cacao TaxID=3641 RepID=A0A061EEQ2_THECC|nr:Uncharacterized protein TCM_010660 [Theobroma cacao]